MAIAERVTRAFRSSPKRLPPTATAAGSVAVAGFNGLVGHGNVELYRQWARGSHWVRAAINIRNNQIATAEWDIVPEDPTKEYSIRLQKEIKQLFVEPNDDDGFDTFNMAVIEDLLTLDSGCIEKNRSLDGRLRKLHPVDAGTVKISQRWDGDPKEHRFFWYPDHTEHARWFNDDFVHLKLNPNTMSPLGIAPLETLKAVIDALLTGDDFQLRQLKGAAPDGLLDLGEGLNPNQLADFMRYWTNEVAGKGAMAFIGGTKGAKFHPFRQGAKDMAFMEWTVFLVRGVAVCYGLSPKDLGLTFDINKATAESETQNTEDRGQKPLMEIVQNHYTRRIVHDKSFGGRDNNLKFAFKALNLKETKQKADINEKALSGTPWKTVDEARVDDGRPPLGGKLGEMLIMSVANGVVAIDPLDIPTAREYFEAVSQKAATPQGPAPDAPDSPAPKEA